MMKKTNLRKATTLLVVLMLGATLVACGGVPTEAVTIEDIQPVVEVAQEVVEEVAKTVEETKAEETVEEVTQQPEPEVETETYPTEEAWIENTDCSVPVLTVYNTETQEGTVIEKEQMYTVKKGDELILCSKFADSGTSISCIALQLEEIKSLNVDTKLGTIYKLPEESNAYNIYFWVTPGGDDLNQYELQFWAIVE